MIFGYLPTNHFLVPLCQWFVSCIGGTSSMLMCLHQPGAHRHEALDLRMCPRDMNEFDVGVTWPPGSAAEDMVCWFYLLLHISSLHCAGDWGTGHSWQHASNRPAGYTRAVTTAVSIHSSHKYRKKWVSDAGQPESVTWMNTKQGCRPKMDQRLQKQSFSAKIFFSNCRWVGGII